MNFEIKVNLKNIVGEFLGLAKPGNVCDADGNDKSSLVCYNDFEKVCKNGIEHTFEDMAKVAALLVEMQNKHIVPDEYVELSKGFSGMVKENKKLDISESRDYVFFAYECMREIEKLENKVQCSVEPENAGVYAIASQEDDISCVVVVNNSSDFVFADVEIEGLPGRAVSIDYYYADEYNQLSIACNTDTKLDKTKIVIPMTGFSLHLFKIR
ncbi:MAG: hypothetical protein IKI97_02135 [Clostridia bacterium]|nr:hypothetical protein [Clostridia bacterium]